MKKRSDYIQEIYRGKNSPNANFFVLPSYIEISSFAKEASKSKRGSYNFGRNIDCCFFLCIYC